MYDPSRNELPDFFRQVVFPVAATAVTLSGGLYLYAWKEQRIKGDGSYADADAPRKGSDARDPLVEVNNLRIPVPFYGWARLRGARSDGQLVYEFDSAETLFSVKVTSVTVDSDGNYPAVLTYLTGPSTWTDDAAVIKLRAANGETLELNKRYHGRYSCQNGSGEDVYVSDHLGVTVEEADGSPSYAGVTKVQFNQAVGFSVSQPAAGVALVSYSGAGSSVTWSDDTPSGGESDPAGSYTTNRVSFDNTTGFDVRHTTGPEIARIRMLAAGAGQAGIVTATGTQTFAGDKSFAGAATFDANLNIGNNCIIGWPSAPATASSAGKIGQLAQDGSFLYVCTALNTWKRVAISTF